MKETTTALLHLMKKHVRPKMPFTAGLRSWYGVESDVVIIFIERAWILGLLRLRDNILRLGASLPVLCVWRNGWKDHDELENIVGFEVPY